MKKLHLSEDLALPVDAVTQKLAWLGRTGSGKTYGASKLAEEMLAADAQVVILDAVGVWYGLRLAADGKGKGIEIPVFGGLHGDVPLEPTGGALMANLIVDRGISVVIDVSQFESDAAKARFAHEWGDRFFFRKKAAPSAVHIFIEECQEFMPQEPMKGEERMLHAFQRISKLGRNFGIGVSLISQRPQEVNKKALNQTECLFAFQMTGPQERTAIKKWVEEKGLDEIVDVLPKLKVGEAHVWSPQWLQISKTVQIARKQTFNASSTPVGKQAAARQLAPIDLDQVRRDMAATIERAKAEDPRELRKTIVELRQKLAAAEKAKPAPTPAAKPPRIVEKLILKDRAASRLESSVVTLNAASCRLEEAAKRAQAAAETTAVQVAEIKAALAAARAPVSREVGHAVATTLQGAGGAGHRTGAPAASQPAPTSARGRGIAALIPDRPPAPRTAAVDGDLSAPEQRVLDALLGWEAAGVATPTKIQVGFMAGYRVAKDVGGTFGNILGKLRTRGLLEYPAPGLAVLTEAGRAVARAPREAPTTDALQRAIHDRLEAPESRVLSVLVEVYPGALRKQEVGARAGYQVGPDVGGTFGNILGRLRSLGLIDYPRPGEAVARPVLFLEGA